ncbi:IS630 family transposase [Streptomyces cinereospinus]|uniref:IS630 family transposase n=1 Tax=Streptomyces cinereospinus TaxID=285561 RepID=UPI00337E4C0F
MDAASLHAAGVGPAVPDHPGPRGGASNNDVAARLGSTPHAVGRWRARFVEHRIAGLGDMPVRGPGTVTDEQVAAVVKRTLESTPKNATRWSTRVLAQEMGLSQSTVSRIWRAFGLQPHRSETLKLATGPCFIDKVHDVVGLYLDPPERAVVFCADEKSPIQALDRSQPVLPMMPGVPQRITHGYVRAGTTTVFAAVEVATGKVIGSLHRRHRAEEFGFRAEGDDLVRDAVGDAVGQDLDGEVHPLPRLRGRRHGSEDGDEPHGRQGPVADCVGQTVARQPVQPPLRPIRRAGA